MKMFLKLKVTLQMIGLELKLSKGVGGNVIIREI